MSSPLSQPSSRLLRAAAAEQAKLARRREQLAHERQRLAAQLTELDDTLGAIEERLALLSTLGQPLKTVSAADAAACEPPGDSRRVLRGSAVRETAVRVLISHPRRIEALHYRDWYQLVRQAGYAVAGSDPLAVFLTQLTRSPAVHKSTRAGVYGVDRQAPHRIRQRLEQLACDLREVTVGAPDPVELATVRARRRELDRAISRQERALEETRRALGGDTEQTLAERVLQETAGQR
jgi:hypothetical protein